MRSIQARILAFTGLTLIFIYIFLIIFMPEIVQKKADKINPYFQQDYFVFHQLFNKLGYTVRRWHSNAMPPDDVCLIIFDLDLTKIDPDLYLDWLNQGNTLFIAGSIAQELVDDIYIIRDDLQETHQVSEPFSSSTRQISFATDRFILDQKEKVTPILQSRNGNILQTFSYNNGHLIVLSDSSLLRNDSVQVESTAIFLNDLLKPFFYKTIYILDKMPAQNISTTKTSIIFSTKMRLFTLQVFIIGLVFILWRGRRIAEPTQYKPGGRRDLKEHLHGVARLFNRFRADKIIFDINKAYFFYQLRKTNGIRHMNSQKDIIEFVCRHLNLSQAHLTHILEYNHNVKSRSVFDTCHELNDILNQLNRPR